MKYKDFSVSTGLVVFLVVMIVAVVFLGANVNDILALADRCSNFIGGQPSIP